MGVYFDYYNKCAPKTSSIRLDLDNSALSQKHETPYPTHIFPVCMNQFGLRESPLGSVCCG